jgi:hypothetical protein
VSIRSSSIRHATSGSLAFLLFVPLAACGKKGPPLQPLRLVPAAASEVSARRASGQVELRFLLPTANANGPGAIDLDHVEVYAITVGPGAPPPPNRELLSKARMVGAIPVKPVPEEGAPAPPATDTRPSAGDRVRFLEQLTEDKLKPVPLPVQQEAAKPAAAATPPAATPPVATPPENPPAVAPPDPAVPPAGAPAKPGAPAAAAAPAPDAPSGVPQGAPAAAPAPVAATLVTEPTRIYVVRGISRGGRPGPPSPRLPVPLVSPVVAPSAVVVRMPSETAIAVEWTPPVAEPGGPPLTFNVYKRESPGTPLNQSPLTDVKFETAAGALGTEQCFVVRTMQATQNVTIESDVSAPACLTPADTFAPAAPKGLQAVVEEGAINLIWEPNAEADIAGYLVLRGEAPGDTLQRLTPAPIADASYRDASVTPGVRYVYAVVAIDKATPPNTSPQSAPEAATAR